MLAVFLRLHCPQLRAEQVLHWQEPAEPLEGRWVWRDSPQPPRSPWERNLQGWLVDDGAPLRVPAGADSRPCDISWTSGNYQLRRRLVIPDDADVVHISDAMVLNRTEASAVLGERILQRLLAA
jgi:hypothetical protein